MKHISSSLEELLETLEIEPEDSGQPWIGDPWKYDVHCNRCSEVYPSSLFYCPRCDSEEATPIER